MSFFLPQGPYDPYEQGEIWISDTVRCEFIPQYVGDLMLKEATQSHDRTSGMVNDVGFGTLEEFNTRLLAAMGYGEEDLPRTTCE